MIQHGETGRFLSPNCDDPNCGGRLVATTQPAPFHEPIWACDGLTHETDRGPLVACGLEFPRSAR
jgi:hypothetical protein